jgi:hypothetical protein
MLELQHHWWVNDIIAQRRGGGERQYRKRKPIERVDSDSKATATDYPIKQVDDDIRDRLVASDPQQKHDRTIRNAGCEDLAADPRVMLRYGVWTGSTAALADGDAGCPYGEYEMPV